MSVQRRTGKVQTFVPLCADPMPALPLPPPPLDTTTGPVAPLSQVERPFCYTLAQAASVLGISERTMSELTMTNQIPYVRIGQRRKIIRRSTLMRFLAANETYARNDPTVDV